MHTYRERTASHLPKAHIGYTVRDSRDPVGLLLILSYRLVLGGLSDRMRRHHEWQEKHARIQANKQRLGMRLPLMKGMATRRRSILCREPGLGEDVGDDLATALSDKFPVAFLQEQEAPKGTETDTEGESEEDPVLNALRTARGGPIQQAMVCRSAFL